jgi:DNA polymerase-1
MKLLVVLDYPTMISKKSGMALVGTEKKLMEGLLQGLPFTSVDFTFALKEKPEQKIPNPLELGTGRNYLTGFLKTNHYDRILAMGAIADLVLRPFLEVPDKIFSRRGLMWKSFLVGYQPLVVTTIPLFYCTGKEENADRFRWIVMDIQKLAYQDGPFVLSEYYSEKRHLTTILNPRKAIKWLKSFNPERASFDIETTGIDSTQNTLTAIGFAYYKGDQIFVTTLARAVLYEPEVIHALYDFLCNRCGPGRTQLIAHNSKFETKWMVSYFRQNGYEPKLLDWNMQDTILLNYVLDERKINSSPSPHGLKTLARERFDDPGYAIDFKDWDLKKQTNESWRELHEYLALDVVYTFFLWEQLVEEIKEENPEGINLHDNVLVPATLAFAYIELRGTRLAIDYMEHLIEVNEKEMKVQMQILVDQLKKRGASAKVIKEINPNSYVKVREILYDILKTKNHFKNATDKENLLRIVAIPGTTEDQKQVIQAVLKYRLLSKVVSTYLKGMIDLADVRGYVHTEFNVNGTSTGRLSSSKPNLQNIPTLMGKDIRRAFVPPLGYVHVSMDYSQMELRVAGYLSKDEVMYTAYLTGRDIHTEVAAAAFNTPYEEVTYEQRYAAKYIDFGVIYGRSAQSLVDSLELGEFNWTADQAQQFIDDFLGQFKGLETWIQNQHEIVAKQQFVGTPNGRRRRWPLILPGKLNSVKRQSVNSPIQGLASDFTVMAIIEIEKFLQHNSRAKIVNTVHDEINLWVREEDVEEVVPQILKIMETTFPLDDFDMPLGIDAEIGYNWGDLVEFDKWVEGVRK